MALTTQITINVERPSLGETMNQIRSWLDSQKIQPASFKPVVVGGGVIFEISFLSADEAELFRQEFV